ncbi:MAG: non-homologous end-joining DNA ligase [Anaerolineae bacterium]
MSPREELLRLHAAGRDLEISHPNKVFWPQLRLTKGDLLRYYQQVSRYVLPRLRDRPFVMKPYPGGAGGRSFYRWEIPAYAPPWVHRWPYEPRTEERRIEMVVIQDLADLLWVAGQACIELHPWLSRRDDPEHPDLVLFDLDPGPGVGLSGALYVAGLLRAFLERQRLRCYAKTSGGKGIHVLVPVVRSYLFRDVRAWVRRVAAELQALHPHEVTTNKALTARRGKVLVDYAQNGLGKSVAAPYSARATPLATVSAPLTWKEVAHGKVRAEDFTLLTMPKRLQKVGDLLAGIEKGQELPEGAL